MSSRMFMCMILAIVAIISSSCGEVEDPLPEAPLETYITSGPEDGSAINEPSATFQYRGSNELVQEFSYRCTTQQETGGPTSVGNWSAWSPDTSIILEHLDQGDYVFEVRGRYEPENEDETPARRTFTVDIPGPGILLKPFKQEAILGEEFEIDVVADHVEDVMLVHLILKFELGQLQALDATPGGIFQDYPPAFFKTIDNSEGVVDITISTIGAEPSRINGTETIATIRFKSLSAGETIIDFDSASEFRDSENNPIYIMNRIGSLVEIAQVTQ
jgi:hypothetical protein